MTILKKTQSFYEKRERDRNKRQRKKTQVFECMNSANLPDMRTI